MFADYLFIVKMLLSIKFILKQGQFYNSYSLLNELLLNV